MTPFRTVGLGCGVALGCVAGAIAQVEWTEISPATSPPAAPSIMAFDEARGCAVLVGGGGSGGDFGTWEWDGVTWTQRFPASSPPTRDFPVMVYDRSRERIVLGGGTGSGIPPAPFYDTWEWDGADWELRSAQGPSLLGLSSKAAAFDETKQRVVLVSAFQGWEWDGDEWVQEVPVPALPYPLFEPAMVSDTARERLVLYGPIAGLWEWDGNGWTRILEQAQIPTGFDGMAWDRNRRLTVLLGVCCNERFRSWEWDGVALRERFPSAAPVVRFRPALAYDTPRATTVLFGGAFGSFADTWHYATAKPAVLETFGTGCAGTVGVPQLEPAPYDLPWLGSSVRLSVGPLPVAAPAFLLLGISNSMAGLLPLPFDLGVIGMPSCTLYTSIERSFPMANTPAESVSTGSATLDLPMPTAPVLVGTRFFMQAVVADPAANPPGLIASDAQEGVLGLR